LFLIADSLRRFTATHVAKTKHGTESGNDYHQTNLWLSFIIRLASPTGRAHRNRQACRNQSILKADVAHNAAMSDGLSDVAASAVMESGKCLYIAKTSKYWPFARPKAAFFRVKAGDNGASQRQYSRRIGPAPD
jgi:hypothetical protein